MQREWLRKESSQSSPSFELMYHSLRLLLNCLCDELVLGDGRIGRNGSPREPRRHTLVGNEISLCEKS